MIVRRFVTRALSAAWDPEFLVAAVATCVLLTAVASLRNPGTVLRNGRTPTRLPAAFAPRPVDRALFTRGSCTEFGPATGYRGKTVFLDAGHGGGDPGGTGVTRSGTDISEAQVNLRVEIDTMGLLTRQGYRVVVSRTRQSTVGKLRRGDTGGGLLTPAGARADIAARDRCANMAHADLLVGIYMNTGDSGPSGSVTVYDRAPLFWPRSRRFATLLQHDVLAKLNSRGHQVPDGGVHSGGRVGVRMPGARIEPLSIADPVQASLAYSSPGQHLIAAGITEAIRRYFTRRLTIAGRG
jgi:N-acetylmuramoyl-L-alanine amidase